MINKGRTFFQKVLGAIPVYLGVIVYLIGLVIAWILYRIVRGLRWFAALIFCSLLILSCNKEPFEKDVQYENTIAEAFRVLDTCGIRELETLDIRDLSNYEEKQWRSLEDSLSTQGDYFCISRKVDQGEKTYYIQNTLLFLNFLSVYSSVGPNYWDVNGDQEVNTSDLIQLLTAYDTEIDVSPDFSCYDIFSNFGEGNTWLDYACDEPSISFGWIHRTPYDEINGGNYMGYNLYSFTIDVVHQDSVEFFEYIRP